MVSATTEPQTPPEVTEELVANRDEGVENRVPSTEAGTELEARSTESAATEAEFDLDALPEWKAIGGKDAAPETKLPGKSLEQVEAEHRQAQAGRYHQLRTQGNEVGGTIFDQIQDGSVTRQQFQNWLVGAINNLHDGNEAYNGALLDEAMKLALGDDYADYSKNQYANRTDALKAIGATVERRLKAEREAAHKKGEWLTRDEAKAIRDASFTAGKEFAAKQKKSGESSETGSGGKSPELPDGLDPRNAPITDINQMLAKAGV